MFQRKRDVQCFFCHSHLPTPRDPANFRCSVCSCLNRYEKDGQIASFEPAMHDEALNSRSFMKRASPSKDRIPTSFSKSPFCHTCQTNQMLLVNLLSNYLPLPESTDYEFRLAGLSDYRESLYLRYPPVCDECKPAVEEAIREKDSMARNNALGGWLKETKGKDQQRRKRHVKEKRLRTQLFFWKLRGLLWILGFAIVIVADIVAALDLKVPKIVLGIRPFLPVLVIVSLLWTFWDPTYSTLQDAQLQGRDVRVKGKTNYLRLQGIAWTNRFLTSILQFMRWNDSTLDIFQMNPTLKSMYFFASCFIEITVMITSLSVLRLRKPPVIRLIDTSTRKPEPTRAKDSGSPVTTSPPRKIDPDLLATLSLSSNPIVQPKPRQQPVFGTPSLIWATPALVQPPKPAKDPNEMDWSPTSPEPHLSKQLKSDNGTDDASWLRPQRFFAPEKPTGLEELLDRTRLIEDVQMADALGESRRSFRQVILSRIFKLRWRWLLATMLLLAIVLWRLRKSAVDKGNGLSEPIVILPHNDVHDLLYL